MTYIGHTSLSESAVDDLNIIMAFDDFRLTCYPEALNSINTFMLNYLSSDTCPVSLDAYRASGCRNLKTLLAFRSWFEDENSLLPRAFPANSFDTTARLTIFNGIMLFPTAMYPPLSPSGVLLSPEDDCLSLFTREFVMQMRTGPDHVENSLDVQPIRLLAPRGAKRPEMNNLSSDPSSRNYVPTPSESSSLGQVRMEILVVLILPLTMCYFFRRRSLSMGFMLMLAAFMGRTAMTFCRLSFPTNKRSRFNLGRSGVIWM